MNNQQDKRFFLGNHTNQYLLLCAFGNVNGELKVQELQNNNLFTLQQTGNADGKVVISPTNKTISIDNVNIVITKFDDNDLYALYNGSLLSSFQLIDQFFRKEPQQRTLNDAIHDALKLMPQNHEINLNQSVQPQQLNQSPQQQLNQSQQQGSRNYHDRQYSRNPRNFFKTFHVNTHPFEAKKFANYLSLGDICGNCFNKGRK